LSVLQIIERYGVRKSYIYKLACNHDWRRVYERVSSGKPYVKYHEEDVHDVLGRSVLGRSG